ncbi:MAG TPA: Maf family protein [Polyangiaceae bacterium]|jgi:septum formation protein|nr:Maf family protein [Polyangiaceae bacterium]
MKCSLHASTGVSISGLVNGRVISPGCPLVLGSASPRRRELLTGLGIEHIVLPAQVVEDEQPGERAVPYVERIVEAKRVAVEQAVARQKIDHAAILVADTTVVLGDEILGKPSDERDALRLLKKIAGREHTVLTRYAISIAGQAPLARTVSSQVTLRPASDELLERYAHTGEGLDKAGAYAVQGLGAFLVRAISGSWSNVVGLPTCELVEDLSALSLLGEFPRLR